MVAGRERQHAAGGPATAPLLLPRGRACVRGAWPQTLPRRLPFSHFHRHWTAICEAFSAIAVQIGTDSRSNQKINCVSCVEMLICSSKIFLLTKIREGICVSFPLSLDCKFAEQLSKSFIIAIKIESWISRKYQLTANEIEWHRWCLKPACLFLTRSQELLVFQFVSSSHRHCAAGASRARETRRLIRPRPRAAKGARGAPCLRQFWCLCAARE